MLIMVLSAAAGTVLALLRFPVFSLLPVVVLFAAGAAVTGKSYRGSYRDDCPRSDRIDRGAAICIPRGQLRCRVHPLVKMRI